MLLHTIRVNVVFHSFSFVSFSCISDSENCIFVYSFVINRNSAYSACQCVCVQSCIVFFLPCL